LWGIASLVDAFHVPKLLSQQLLPFGRSGDGLGVLTFEVEQFSVLFVPGGRSASSVFFVCSSCSCSASLSIGFGFGLWLEVVSDSPQQRADGPRVPGGQSACSPRTVRYSGLSLEVLFAFFGHSAAQGRTVRGVGADSPQQQAGRSAWPVRTVRLSWPDSPPEPECFVSSFYSSLLLSCFRVCFKESFLRLEVDP
jgi:hypothetical protein